MRCYRLTVQNNKWGIVSYLWVTEVSEDPPRPCIGLEPSDLIGDLPIKGGEQLGNREV